MKRILKLIPSVLILWALCPAAAVLAEDVNEDEMFSDSATLVADPQAIVTTKKETKDYSLGFSGRTSLDSQYQFKDTNGLFDDTYADTTLVNNFYFDARYLSKYKLFANLESVGAHPWDTVGQEALPAHADRVRSRFTELFVDTPVMDKIYLRWGKQVLQWGRCRLWNPSDLINVDKETFIRRTSSRDGVYGLKAHIPWGTKYNLYAFVDTGKNVLANRTGGAVKFEFLVADTEMAFSYWNKPDYLPVYGYDISTQLLDWDIAAEVSASKGPVRERLVENGGVLSQGRENDEWVTRASLDLSRSFRFNDQPDKISLTWEGFYNGAGYKDNIFKDERTYTYASPVSLSDGTTVTSGSKSLFFLSNGLYEPNYYGQYYAAVFTSVNSFFRSEFTWNNNYIQNLSDNSSILSTGVHYQNIKNWEADLEFYFFLGGNNREYTVSSTEQAVRLSVGYKF